MKRFRPPETWEAFLGITNAAERFVNRSPRSKRLEGERQALLDAIRQAQLVLSVKRMPTLSEHKRASVANLAGQTHSRKGRS
jgi:hypothetical protein